MLSVGRGRQSGDCPNIRFLSDSEIELDFGNGCSSEDFGYARGRIRVTFPGLQLDENGDIVSFESITLQFQDFYSDEDAVTLNGSLTFRNINRDDAIGLSLNLRGNYGPNCWEQVEFSGTVAYQVGWFTDYFTIQGTGTFQSSAYGRFNLAFNNLIFSSNCDQPVGGNIQVSAGAFSASLSFVESQCGSAFLSINQGAPTAVDMGQLPYEPCGG